MPRWTLFDWTIRFVEANQKSRVPLDFLLLANEVAEQPMTVVVIMWAKFRICCLETYTTVVPRLTAVLVKFYCTIRVFAHPSVKMGEQDKVDVDSIITRYVKWCYHVITMSVVELYFALLVEVRSSRPWRKIWLFREILIYKHSLFIEPATLFLSF